MVLDPSWLLDLHDPTLVISHGYVGPDRRRAQRTSGHGRADARSVVASAPSGRPGGRRDDCRRGAPRADRHTCGRRRRQRALPLRRPRQGRAPLPRTPPRPACGRPGSRPPADGRLARRQCPGRAPQRRRPCRRRPWRRTCRYALGGPGRGTRTDRRGPCRRSCGRPGGGPTPGRPGRLPSCQPCCQRCCPPCRRPCGCPGQGGPTPGRPWRGSSCGPVTARRPRHRSLRGLTSERADPTRRAELCVPATSVGAANCRSLGMATGTTHERTAEGGGIAVAPQRSVPRLA